MLKENKKVLLVGVGQQGMNIVKEMNPVLRDVEKLNIDSSESEQTLIEDHYLNIPFTLELSAWSLTWPIKEWFEEEENKEILRQYFDETYEFVICVSELGDAASLVAKEFMKWLDKKCKKNTDIYFIGMLPVKNTTECVSNFITQKMVEFLKKDTVKYVLVEKNPDLEIENILKTALSKKVSDRQQWR